MFDLIFFVGVCIALVCIYIAMKTKRGSEKVDNLKGRPVFITGCDTGFGRLLAEHLDKMGVPVYAGCYSQESTAELAEICSENIKPVQIDVANTESVHGAAKYVEKDLNGKALWAIVNNAGISGPMVPFEWITREDCRQVLEVNTLGAYDVTLAFLPLIKRGKEGRIVNMASVAGKIGLAARPYTVSKFAVEGFSDGLSWAVEPYNITVHTMEPAFFITSMCNEESARKNIRKYWEKADPKIREEFGGEEYLELLNRGLRACVIREKPTKQVFAWDRGEAVVSPGFLASRKNAEKNCEDAECTWRIEASSPEECYQVVETKRIN